MSDTAQMLMLGVAFIALVGWRLYKWETDNV